MNKISVLIQAYNEEKNIAECIQSARLLTDDVLVVNTGSTDSTVQLAKKEGATVYTVEYAKYVEPVRKWGIQQVKNEWVFILDADERITKELTHEIKQAIESEEYTYYRIPRKNIFGGKKWLEHGGWSPDYQIRLIKVSAFKDWPSRIHSTPEIEGECGYLKNGMLHYFHPNLENMVTKTAMFESIEADLLFKAGRPVNTPTFFRKYFGELYRRLVKKQGYRDGIYGIIESMYQAFSKTVTYLMLYEKYKKNSRI